MPRLANMDELRSWLDAHGIDRAHWGQGHAKSIEDLWIELQEGESALQDEPPMRLTRLVQVLIRSEGRTLVEARQTLRDERERPRCMPPSEKLKLDEDPLAAACRCLREELGVEPAEVRLLGQATREARESISYPGLQTRYTIYSAEARVNGLPERPFSTLEMSSSVDLVRNHHWIWVRDYVQPAESEEIESGIQ